jgi:UDP-N-acetylmuramate dehydrogenase
MTAAERQCREDGLTGLEFAWAMPGTAGGALRMNAGAHDSELRDVLLRARLVSASGTREVVPADLGMGYRRTNLTWTEVVSEIELALGHDDPELIAARVQALQAQASPQPTAARSLGSVFHDPVGVPLEGSPDAFARSGRPRDAGTLIERAGLAGHRIGGARISPKHCNYIENDESGSTSDIVALIELARATVCEQFGVLLHTEVLLLDRAGYRPLLDDLATGAR